jgi:hypothetical protein
VSGVVSVRPIAAPEPESWQIREFDAPCASELRLRFDSPDEYAMGGFNWRVTLLRGRAVVRTWDRRAGDPEHLAPWSHDGAKLAFPLRSSGRSGIAAAGADGTDLSPPEWPHERHLASVAWAPARRRVLLLALDGFQLLDADFALVAEARWQKDRLASPVAGWVAPDGCFFVLSGTVLRFYDPREGALQEEVPLEPAALLPYDESAFAATPRDRYVLRIPAGASGAGSLLDTWSQCRLRPRTNELLLMTYRPTEARPARLPIEVEPRWVSVQLAP